MQFNTKNAEIQVTLFHMKLSHVRIIFKTVGGTVL